MGSRMRITRGATGRRRAGHSNTQHQLATDTDGAPQLRHRVTPSTGKYKGRVVVDVTAREAKKLAKQEARAKQVEEAQKAAEEDAGADAEAPAEEKALDAAELSKK